CIVQIDFDFIDHALYVRTSEGAERRLPLVPQSVADFYARFAAACEELDLPMRIHGVPNEVMEAIPFARDRTHHAYDREAVQRFWRVLLSAYRVFKYFRTGFLGKVSPVHLFWGGLDLAVTRFSGRRAPLHPGGIPNLPDTVTREAYSHEVSSAGFWPGGAGAPGGPFFSSYAYPTPDGFAEARVAPEAARFDPALGEFMLNYDAV